MPANINLFRKYNYNSVFIETGSCDGAGIKNALFAGYKDIYSIELADKYYHYCLGYFKYNDNIHLFHGDSVRVLPRILENIKESATFWLDAHYSGGDTDFVNVLSPLMIELEIIKGHHIKTHTILVDDLREWNRNHPAIGFDIEDIKAKILEINPNYRFSQAAGYTPNDILVAEMPRSKPINIVIFSKDRAMQLELLLRSMNKFVAYNLAYDIHVLFTYSTDEFAKGYEKLIAMAEYPNVTYHLEDDFKKNLLGIIDPTKEHLVFFVDDNVFKGYSDYYDRQMDVFDWNESILCRSLRLSTSLSFCYPTQKPMKQPRFYTDNVFKWAEADGDYGYPMSLDGNIYRTKDIYLLLISCFYNNPNSLEGALNRHTKGLAQNMMCYNDASIINNPINRVQDTCLNIHGNITAESLNEQFLKGDTIALSNFEGLKNVSCHQEVPLIFIKDASICDQPTEPEGQVDGVSEEPVPVPSGES